MVAWVTRLLENPRYVAVYYIHYMKQLLIPNTCTCSHIYKAGTTACEVRVSGTTLDRLQCVYWVKLKMWSQHHILMSEYFPGSKISQHPRGMF